MPGGGLTTYVPCNVRSETYPVEQVADTLGSGVESDPRYRLLKMFETFDAANTYMAWGGGGGGGGWAENIRCMQPHDRYIVRVSGLHNRQQVIACLVFCHVPHTEKNSVDIIFVLIDGVSKKIPRQIEYFAVFKRSLWNHFFNQQKFLNHLIV